MTSATATPVVASNPVKSPPKNLRKFRLLFGDHIQTDSDGKERRYNWEGKLAGNIIETDIDLAARYNGQGSQNHRKFEPIMESQQLATAHLPEHCEVFDTKNESVDQFLTRIGLKKGNGISQPAQSNNEVKPNLVVDSTTFAHEDKVIQDMSIKELIGFAADEEIDIPKNVNKGDKNAVLKVVMDHRKNKR